MGTAGAGACASLRGGTPAAVWGAGTQLPERGSGHQSRGCLAGRAGLRKRNRPFLDSVANDPTPAGIHGPSLSSEPALRTRERVESRIIAQDFDGFFRTEYVRLGKALFLLCGSRADAEDLSAEAMLKVLRRWDKVQQMDSPQGYLYRVGMNLFRRWAAGKPRTEVGLEDRGGSDDETRTSDIRLRVQTALAHLSPEQREAVVLIEYIGLSSEEAGALLDIDPASVRGRLFRAKKALRAELGDIDE